jgi:hypothetical protein
MRIFQLEQEEGIIRGDAELKKNISPNIIKTVWTIWYEYSIPG